LGVRNAKGKYISYLDGDDVWLPNKLEQQVAILESRPEAVMVHGPLLEWYSWTKNPMHGRSDHLYGVGEDGVHPFADTLVKPPKLLALFLHKEEFIPSGILILREIIEQVGGSEETFSGSFEDAVVNVKICLKFTVFVSGQSWYKYRIHPDSCQRTAIKAKQANTNLLRYLNWVVNYLSEQGVKDHKIWQALRYALWPYHHPKLHCLLECYRSLIRQIEKPIIHIGRRTLSVSFRNWLWYRWLRCRKNLIN
jgi:glycosyltransferase involved in cell wall biosynthesis